MNLRLAAASVFLVVLTPSLRASAQSMPVGQISRQIVKPQPETVKAFRNELDKSLGDSDVSSEDAVRMLNSIDNSTNLAAAVSTAAANAPHSPTAKAVAVSAVNTARASVPTTPPCVPNADGTFTFRLWFPTAGCTPDGITDFFKVSGTLSMINTVQYLYNPNQSTNQVNADFFTATFPLGFQAIFSGTATAGSSQPAGTSTSTTSTSTTSTGTTDSVSTAVSKLEQGGDFNVRFPFPFLYHVTSRYGVYMLSSPSVGFNVSGLSGQNTITESTEYNLNLPIELYAQTASIEQTAGVSNALLYADVKPAIELVSPAFATAIGLKSNRYFSLVQAAAGLEFSGSVRVGFQYFFGPSQVYQVPTATGTTTKTGKVGGIHLVVSFSPSKSKQ